MMENLYPSNNISIGSGRVTMQSSLYDALIQDFIFIEEYKNKKIKFEKLWIDIHFLENISSEYFDALSGKMKHINGKKIVENLYKKFPDFFESDKKLFQISGDELSAINRYLIGIFNTIESHYHHPYIKDCLAHAFKNPDISGNYGPSWSDLKGIHDYHEKIKNTYPKTKSKKSLDYYDNRRDKSDANHYKPYYGIHQNDDKESSS